MGFNFSLILKAMNLQDKEEYIFSIAKDAMNETHGEIPQMLKYFADHEKDPLILSFLNFSFGSAITEKLAADDIEDLVKQSLKIGANMAMQMNTRDPDPDPENTRIQEPDNPVYYG